MQQGVGGARLRRTAGCAAPPGRFESLRKLWGADVDLRAEVPPEYVRLGDLALNEASPTTSAGRDAGAARSCDNGRSKLPQRNSVGYQGAWTIAGALRLRQYRLVRFGMEIRRA